jgi:hypothetical protein
MKHESRTRFFPQNSPTSVASLKLAAVGHAPHVSLSLAAT